MLKNESFKLMKQQLKASHLFLSITSHQPQNTDTSLFINALRKFAKLYKKKTTNNFAIFFRFQPKKTFVLFSREC